MQKYPKLCYENDNFESVTLHSKCTQEVFNLEKFGFGFCKNKSGILFVTVKTVT